MDEMLDLVCGRRSGQKARIQRVRFDPAIVGTSDGPSSNSLNEAHLSYCRPSWRAACDGRARRRRPCDEWLKKNAWCGRKVRCDATARETGGC